MELKLTSSSRLGGRAARWFDPNGRRQRVEVFRADKALWQLQEVQSGAAPLDTSASVSSAIT